MNNELLLSLTTISSVFILCCANLFTIDESFFTIGPSDTWSIYILIAICIATQQYIFIEHKINKSLSNILDRCPPICVAFLLLFYVYCIYLHMKMIWSQCDFLAYAIISTALAIAPINYANLCASFANKIRYNNCSDDSKKDYSNNIPCSLLVCTNVEPESGSE